VDTELLVESRIEDGRKLIAELIKEGFDVTVACWVKTSDEGLWFLYIGSTSVEAGKIGDAYITVYGCLARISDASISLSDIKLIPATDPIAKEAIGVRDRYAGKLPTRYHGKRLGKLTIEEAYVYPPLGQSMSLREVMGAVLDLMGQQSPPQPSKFALKSGTTVEGIPVSIERLPAGSVEITLLEPSTGAKHAISADDVSSIR
jgi:hypothetical protein